LTRMDAKSKPPAAGAPSELDRAARIRLARDWRLPMSERLARVHELCKQMTAIAGSAKRR
jgi:hypothetical protein